MAIGGASGQTSGGSRLVGGAVAPGSVVGGPGAALGRVVAIRTGFALDGVLGRVALALWSTVGVRAATTAVIGIRVAVLLLSRSHASLRVVADDVVPGRCRDIVRGYVWPRCRVGRIGSASCVEVARVNHLCSLCVFLFCSLGNAPLGRSSQVLDFLVADIMIIGTLQVSVPRRRSSCLCATNR